MTLSGHFRKGPVGERAHPTISDRSDGTHSKRYQRIFNPPLSKLIHYKIHSSLCPCSSFCVFMSVGRQCSGALPLTRRECATGNAHALNASPMQTLNCCRNGTVCRMQKVSPSLYTIFWKRHLLLALGDHPDQQQKKTMWPISAGSVSVHNKVRTKN